METSLHRQLKEQYRNPDAQLEVPVGCYRIDVVNGDQLVEIQHGSLAAIRDKVSRLLKRHRVLVVKPIVARRQLVRLGKKGGRVLARRMSPKRGSILDLFNELIYFTRVFPHPNLELEAPLIVIEEWRFPGHGRRRRWRQRDHQVEDQKLIEIDDSHRFQTAADLAGLIKARLPSPFHTGHLGEAIDRDRWFSQRVAYCLREMGAVDLVGKQGNSRLYKWRSNVAAAHVNDASPKL